MSEPIGYTAAHLGLNNQKMALLGLFQRAVTKQRPLILPNLSLFNPMNKEHPTVDLGTVFDLDALSAFSGAFGIEMLTSEPISNETGWGCFLLGSGCLGTNASRGLAAINDFASQFFNHLAPHILKTDYFRYLSAVVFDELGVDTVIQLRIEKDWITYSNNHLQHNAENGEEYIPTFQDILAKVRNTPAIPSKVCYVACDEANLPVGKDEIRNEVKSRYGITLIWKSDILSDSQLSKLTVLEMALIDFEMAVKAPYFVGLSRSSFSDLALFEAFSRVRKTITTHYIYNLPGDKLGRRMDNGSEIAPTRVVNRLFAREALIEPSDEDCLWPAILTAHISRFGDFSSEGPAVSGVRGGLLTCGIRGNYDGPIIEGFSLRLAAWAPINVEYRALLDDGSWTSWLQDGEYAGTRGRSRQIRGFSVRLTGPLAGKFNCLCAGSFFGRRDLVVVRDGIDCRAEDEARMEAMQIVFRPAIHEWPGPMRLDRSSAVAGAHNTQLVSAQPESTSLVKRLFRGQSYAPSVRPAEEPIDLLLRSAKLRRPDG